MKTINTFINEKFRLRDDTKIKENPEPEIGKIAVDYMDRKWKIIDFCKQKDKTKLKWLLRKYDMGGCSEIIDDYGPEDYFVAAVERDDEHSHTVFVWAPEGLWYE